MKWLLSLAIVASLMISGCGPRIAGDGDMPATLANATTVVTGTNEKRPLKFVYGTQAVIGKCPSDEGESLILSAIGASIVAQGVNRIGAAIKAAAAEETKQVLVRRNVELRADGSFGPCLLVSRGWFYDEKIPPEPFRAYDKKTGSSFEYEVDKISSIRRSGLPLAATPDFFFEGQFIQLADKKTTTLIPRYAYLDQPISQSDLRPSNSRQILVLFALSDVGKSADLNKGQGATIVLGPLRSGRSKRYPSEDESLVSYTCNDESGCTYVSATQVMRSIHESDWFSLDLPEKERKPMTLQVLVSETRSANAFLGFVAEVFGAVQKDVTTELQTALIPSRHEAAEEAAQAANESAANAYDKAYAEAVAKISACGSSPTDTTKAAEARQSMRTLNKASRNANRGDIFTQEDIDSIELSRLTSAATGCASALAKL